jgi:MFS family permease
MADPIKVPEAIRNDRECQWRSSFIRLGPHSYWYHPISWSDHSNGLDAFVRYLTVRLDSLLIDSLAAKFGRKWGMYILWLFLLVSVTLEVVARRWEVWVRISVYVGVELIDQFVGKMFSGMGVGSMQFLTPTYVSECAPNRIRGITLILYSFWYVAFDLVIRPIQSSAYQNRFSIGQFFGPVALQVMSNTHPGEYLIPLYTQVGRH